MNWWAVNTIASALVLIMILAYVYNLEYPLAVVFMVVGLSFIWRGHRGKWL